jgi:ArsR family transcriptional regulator
MSWDFPDPKTRQGHDPFAQTLNELNSRIAMFVLVETKQQLEQPNEQLAENSVIAINPIAFYKCLTDEIRLKTLMLVKYYGELCVCELMSALQEQSQPKVSRNLALLRKAKILLDRKHGQWVFYRINPDLPEWARSVLATTAENNIAYIEDNISRIACMADRPDKSKFCC